MGMGNDMYIQCFGSGGGGGEQEEQGQVEEENKEHVVVVGGWRWKRRGWVTVAVKLGG